METETMIVLMDQGGGVMNVLKDGTVGTLRSETHGHEPVIIQPIPIHDQVTRHAGKHGDKQDGKGNGFGVGQPGDPMNTLTKGDRHVVAYEAIPLDLRSATRDPEKHDEINRQGIGVGEAGDPSHTITSAFVPGVEANMAVRRLTPIECERLQGFPDGYTNIPWRKKEESPDGPRYKALGNSMAVPVMQWIGKRIANAVFRIKPDQEVTK